MRVIAGKYRGKKLKEFDINSTRPTLDRVKEALFSIVQFDINGAVVLDLFSGTGALGIESVSRGAKKVYLVDNSKDAIKLINDNLTGMEGDYEVVKSDFIPFLTAHKKVKYDLVFLDPPFASNYGKESIQYIIENKMLNDGGTIVFETSQTNTFDKDFEGYTKKVKTYGKVRVMTYKKDE